MAQGWTPPVTQREQGFVDDTVEVLHSKASQNRGLQDVVKSPRLYFESLRRLLSEDLW
jgi:hypothetical protein